LVKGGDLRSSGIYTARVRIPQLLSFFIFGKL
jgi:hypothetical protein